MNPLPLVTALKRDDIDVVGVSGAVPGLDGDVNRDATESLFSRPAPLLLLRLLPMRLFSVKSLKRSGSAAVMHTEGGTTGALISYAAGLISGEDRHPNSPLKFKKGIFSSSFLFLASTQITHIL